MGRTTSVSTAEALSHDGPAIHFGRHLCGLHTFALDIMKWKKLACCHLGIVIAQLQPRVVFSVPALCLPWDCCA